MRLRSTGLGKTELKAECAELKVKDGSLVMTLKTTEPVQWRIRAAMQPSDIRRVIGLLLRGQILLYLLRSLPKIFSRSSEEPGTLTDF